MTKIKSFVFIVIFTISVLGLYAEAPELRNVMPNSWQKITRLSRDEEARFLQNNAGLLEKSVREGLNQAETSLLRENKNVKGTTLVYYEPIGGEKFYRLITVNSSTYDFTNQWEIQFLQTLVYEFRGRMEILAIGSYNASITSDDKFGKYKVCKSLDIISSGGRAKGVLTTHVEIPFNSDRKTYTYLVKGQPRGLNYSAYALMRDIKEILEKGNGIPSELDLRGLYVYKGLSYKRIEASDFLVDPNIPLRYSLQNAFDGDPATSYVENTENDLMEFRFYFPGLSEKIAIINGYSVNESIYKSNNRIKTITNERFELLPNGQYSNALLGDNYPLQDSILEFQVLDYVSNGYIWVTDIYKGEKYNDTCIAELNLKTDQGWLFGDINE